jgi:hypothetical protein
VADIAIVAAENSETDQDDEYAHQQHDHLIVAAIDRRDIRCRQHVLFV